LERKGSFGVDVWDRQRRHEERKIKKPRDPGGRALLDLCGFPGKKKQKPEPVLGSQTKVSGETLKGKKSDEEKVGENEMRMGRRGRSFYLVGRGLVTLGGA